MTCKFPSLECLRTSYLFPPKALLLFLLFIPGSTPTSLCSTPSYPPLSHNSFLENLPVQETPESRPHSFSPTSIFYPLSDKFNIWIGCVCLAASGCYRQMPPREDGASPKSFTWITGNPRSRKNITQIRRHAGQNSGLKAESSAKAQSSSSPRPAHRSSTKPFRPGYTPPESDEVTEASSSTQDEHQFAFYVDLPTVAAAPSAAISSLGSAAHAHPATATTSQPGSPNTSPPITGPSITEDGAPTRKLAIWDLVNHSFEEEEQHRMEVLASTPRQDTEDDRLDYFGGAAGHAELKHALTETRSHSPRRPRSKSSPPPVLQANISKRRKPAGGAATTAAAAATSSHVSWRLGMSLPHPLMTLSEEDSQTEQILLRTSAFYTAKFESSWSAHLRESGGTYFDSISEMETFAGSITTAAGLLAVERIDSASAILTRVLPTLSDLLISQHPQLYYVLAELSLDTNPGTALGRLRRQLKVFAANASLTILGSAHPITKLLQITFPDADDNDDTAATADSSRLRLRLRELIQRKIHDLHETFFSPTSYQTTGHHYYLARVLAQLGQLDEARRILSHIVRTWEDTYGINDIMPITGLLELTKVHLSSHDFSGDTEFLISEALRRTLTLERAAADSEPPLTATSISRPEAPAMTPRAVGLVHSRLGCLRTLGRLHVMRGNLETAMMQYTAAVNVGLEELGPAVPAVQLALADLDVVSQMVAAQNASQAEEEDDVHMSMSSSSPAVEDRCDAPPPAVAHGKHQHADTLWKGKARDRRLAVDRLTSTSLSTINNEAVADG